MPSHSSQLKKSSDKKSTRDQLAGERAKNVSHVPCKFFRQSTCQAGDKCPFSHDLTADTSQMVCKYFQKGNCKFGNKCALLHITPDGKLGNKKALSLTGTSKSAKKREKNEASKSASSSSGKGSAKASAGSAANSSSPSSSSSRKAAKSNKESSKESNKAKTSPKSEQELVDLAAQLLSKFNGKSGSSPTPQNPASSALSPNAKTPKTAPAAISSPTPVGSIPQSVRSQSANIPQSSKIWGYGRPQLSSGDDFAIMDDEDDVNGIENIRRVDVIRRISQPRKDAEFGTLLIRSMSNENNRRPSDDALLSGEEEEEGYAEQLVPSALQDLLTPLERERRNSRNSQQKSGRVLSSPVLTAPHTMGIRRSSSSSETSGGDLWGPRQAVTPFSRSNNHLSSPPLGSSQLTSCSNSALSSPVIGVGVMRSTFDTSLPAGNKSTVLSKSIQSLSLESQLGVSPWGLSTLVINESEENFNESQTAQKNLYHPFQRYQQSPFLPTQKT